MTLRCDYPLSDKLLCWEQNLNFASVSQKVHRLISIYKRCIVIIDMWEKSHFNSRSRRKFARGVVDPTEITRFPALNEENFLLIFADRILALIEFFKAHINILRISVS